MRAENLTNDRNTSVEPLDYWISRTSFMHATRSEFVKPNTLWRVRDVAKWLNRSLFSDDERALDLPVSSTPEVS